ncbi:MAG TPA: NAD(P)-dependent oxidoreductase [Chitinophagaceae bacterium]|nr:NAD(P)-dependent oxidoreductase [Chitinophagaceae bacterium]
MKIGFIGLGNLGTPIAENLLESHKQLYVFNRTASKATALVKKGAVLCKTVKELLAECDVVFSIVSNDAALKEITEGKNGIAANLKKGGIHVSISTILPATAKELSGLHQQQHNQYVACPVMGRPEAAKAKKLNFLVSGDRQSIETIKPLLQQAGAAGIWEFGDEVTAANTAKLCSNFLIVSAIEAMAEGIQLAKKSGVDARAWMHMMTETLFNAPVYINYGNIILNEKYLPAGFTLQLGLKDVNLVLGQAATVNATMPIGNTLHKQFTHSVEKGLKEHDWTAIAEVLK